MSHTQENCSFEYDVCLSFAGENRPYVKKVASILKEKSVRVFFADFSESELWGKDLYEHFDFIYRKAARFCVVFISKEYARKSWPTHERRSAQARSMSQNSEYVLPARFDNTPVPGLRDTVGYVDLRTTKPGVLVELILEKLGPRSVSMYFPETPDRLYEALDANSEDEKILLQHYAWAFFQSLKMMTVDERRIVYFILRNGCPADLPDNLHIDVEYLKRLSGKNLRQVKGILAKISCLGFSSRLKKERQKKSEFGSSRMIYLEWHDRSVDFGGNFTEIANLVMSLAVDNYCAEHGIETFDRLDFSRLSTLSIEDDGKAQDNP